MIAQSRRRFVGGVLFVLCIAGCSDESGEGTSIRMQSIQGGVADMDHSFAVGVLRTGDGLGICSGFLVAPNLVVTARHCVSRMPSSTIDCDSTTFGEIYAEGDVQVTTEPLLAPEASFVGVADIMMPGAGHDGVCGNDVAILRLEENVQLPAYAVPALDPLVVDGSLRDGAVTAIGYGVDSPEDDLGRSIGVRRIKENVRGACTTDSENLPACARDPEGNALVVSGEFMIDDAGACNGDSGSGVYDQALFDRGEWFALGALSRGSVSLDRTSCVGSAYARLDAWPDLFARAAWEGARHGAYDLPTWASYASECELRGDCTIAPGDAGTRSATGACATSHKRSGAGLDGFLWLAIAALRACRAQRRVHQRFAVHRGTVFSVARWRCHSLHRKMLRRSRSSRTR